MKTESVYIDTQGRGADIVFLHGWALHGGVWQRVASALSEDFCVHCLDLPGHGRSANLSEWSLDGVLGAVVEHFPYPVHVVGWSLGGLVAQHWARCLPERVRSLTLVGSSPCFVQKSDWRYAQTADSLAAMALALETDFDATLQRFLALQTLGSEQARTVLHGLRDVLFAHGRPSGVLPALRVLQQMDYRSFVAEIVAPSLVLGGARDALTPIEASRWLAETLPDARLHCFETAAHLPFLSHEAEFIAYLRAFLLEHA